MIPVPCGDCDLWSEIAEMFLAMIMAAGILAAISFLSGVSLPCPITAIPSSEEWLVQWAKLCWWGLLALMVIVGFIGAAVTSLLQRSVLRRYNERHPTTQ